MDAPEEDLDIKLQKISGDLLADFDKSLPVLLRKPDGSLRSRVRVHETYRLTSQVNINPSLWHAHQLKLTETRFSVPFKSSHNCWIPAYPNGSLL